MNDNDIMKSWDRVMPKYSPRISQQETFDWIQELPPEKKYILLEMPVGGGKSPIGLTVSSWLSKSGMGSSFILTPQKILQNQYETSFDKQLLASMYGKGNYRCEPKDCSCEVGSSIKPSCSSCPYKAAFGRANASPNMVLNYTLALLYFSYLEEKRMPSRKLMVMDECHNLEQQLVNFSTFAISETTCAKISNNQLKLYRPKTMSQAHQWMTETYWPKLEHYIGSLSREIERIESYASSDKLSADDQAIIKNYIRYTRHADNINQVLLCTNEEIEDNYVLVKNDKDFTVKELFGGRAFHGIIKPKAEKFLFMSSTILNKDGFCRDLRINPDEAAFLSLKSEFDPDRRPVMYMPSARMSYGWDRDDPEKNAGRRNMINAIKGILDQHKSDSGIIHTGSFKLSKWIIEELQTTDSHKILNHNPYKDQVVKRDDIIKSYMESAEVEPTVLVSPSITEGLDLKHDLGRFAIFAKVPFPSLGDEWIKRRMDISKDWYQRQTLKEMIQGSGRVCRDHTDWGITYILDESFTFLYNQTKNTVIPKWWLESFTWIK
jgi:Rad3-related DNA helicase